MSEKFAYKPVSAWETYADKKKEIEAFAHSYVYFLNHCKTERETIAFAREKLIAAGYAEDGEGDKFFRPFRKKALFAYRAGEKSPTGGVNLIAAHADSPRLDFKQRPLAESCGLALAKTHYYGGIRKYQWLARPLALHGVIPLASGKIIEVSVGEQENDPVFCVDDLLPHLAKSQATKKLEDLFEAEKLKIIIGHEPVAKGEDKEKEAKDPVKTALLAYLNAKWGVTEEDFISAELEAVPAGPARYVGFDKALIGGYGQDDRICVFCALEAFLNREARRKPSCIILWDKEEIGSDGATGASSRFLRYCLEDVAKAEDVSAARLFMNSRAISADVTAAVDPDFQDAHDLQNSALLGYGPSFSKYTGSRGKYGASDADAEFYAELRALMNAKKIPWQPSELGKVDGGGGGTVALFLAAFGMSVIDMGPALLSMHSPFELCSTADLYSTAQAYGAFFAS